MGRWQTRLTVVAVLTMAAVADGQDRTAPGGPTHHIYITAVDKGGMPVMQSATIFGGVVLTAIGALAIYRFKRT